MANRDLTREETETLERMVDSANLQAVIMALSEICGAKAEHIRENWGDRVLVRTWGNACGILGVLVCRPTIQELSK